MDTRQGPSLQKTKFVEVENEKNTKRGNLKVVSSHLDCSQKVNLLSRWAAAVVRSRHGCQQVDFTVLDLVHLWKRTPSM